MTKKFVNENNLERILLAVLEDVATETSVSARIESLENLGQYAGAFDTRASVPANKSGFSNGITINDFVTVRVDETRSNAVTRYVATAINSSGVITWTYDLTYSTDVSGKQDKLNRTVTGNDNATGTISDTGNNLSIPMPVTVVAPSASSAQITAGTRTLRATLKILIDNIANLFSRVGTAETNIGNKADANHTHAAATRTAIGGVRATSPDGTGTTSFGNNDMSPINNMALSFNVVAIATNLNSLRTPGEWYIYRHPNTATTHNDPPFTTGSTGIHVKVMMGRHATSDPTNCIQLCWRRDSSETWIRHCTSATAWSAWVRMATTADITPANIALTAENGTGTDITTPAIASNSINVIAQSIWAKIRQLANVINTKENTGHTHTIANVTNLQTALDGKSATGHTHSASDVGAAPANHTHTPADIGASATGHTHTIANVTNLQTELNGKAQNAHASTATTFGHGSPANYGHLKQTATARTAAATSDTHSLGTSFGQYALSVTHMGTQSSINLNNFTANGDFLFYNVTTRTNFPTLPSGANTSNPSFYLEVRQFGYDANNLRQRLTMRGTSASFNAEFTRQRNAGTWTSWIQTPTNIPVYTPPEPFPINETAATLRLDDENASKSQISPVYLRHSSLVLGGPPLPPLPTHTVTGNPAILRYALQITTIRTPTPLSHSYNFNGIGIVEQTLKVLGVFGNPIISITGNGQNAVLTAVDDWWDRNWNGENDYPYKNADPALAGTWVRRYNRYGYDEPNDMANWPVTPWKKIHD